MEWVQTTAKTVEEAKDRALDELGVDERDAEFEVLEEPRSGLFGLTRGEARVRARIKPTTPRPKQERGRRRSGGGKGRSGGGRSAGNGGGRGREPRPKETDAAGAGAPETGRSRDGGETGGGRSGGGQGGGGRRRGGRGGGRSGGRSGGGSNRNGSNEGGRSRQGGGGAPADAARDDRPKESKGDVVSDASVKDQAEAAEEFLEGLVAAFGLTATVTSEEVDEAVEVQIQGEDLGLLIGPKGRTLWALQELTKTVVQRQQGGGLSTRIRLDVAGYRERRRVALEAFTKDAAAAVLESGQARALEPMGAADRKVVHDTVNLIDGVATRSEGEDPRRRVVIVPE